MGNMILNGILQLIDWIAWPSPLHFIGMKLKPKFGRETSTGSSLAGLIMPEKPS